jgi:hypothetical protein
MKGNGIWNEIMCRDKGLLKGGAKGFTKHKELCQYFSLDTHQVSPGRKQKKLGHFKRITCPPEQAFQFLKHPTKSRGKIMLCKVPSDYTEKIIAGFLVFQV